LRNSLSVVSDEKSRARKPQWSLPERIGYAKDTGRSWTLGNAEYAVDIVKGVFIKGGPVYEGSGF
jgi:hypothetical protein